MSEFGKFISERRMQLGYKTRKSLAIKSEITPEYLKKIEDTDSVPSDEIVLRLADALEVDRKQLLFLAKKSAAPEEAKQFFSLNTDEATDLDRINYQDIIDPAEVRKKLLNDNSINDDIRAVIEDEEFWERLKPTGEEIQAIITASHRYGPGSNVEQVKILCEEIIQDHRKHLAMARLIAATSKKKIVKKR
jgi:transcriptional regulator with XRE-family HTH domain